MIKISVIITCYNCESYIERTINSIRNQKGNGSLFELEIIAIDDCSPDGTLKKLNLIKGIRTYSTQKNSGGPNKGRNIGLVASTGDYICIADHDDIWHEERIKTLLPYLNLAPIITSGYTLINKTTGKEIIRTNSCEQGYIEYKTNETFLKRLIKSNNGQLTYLGSIIFKSELKNILFEEHFGMLDYDWLLRLFHNQKTAEICRPLYYRYVDENNLSLNQKYRSIDYYFALMFIEQFERLYTKEYKTAVKRINGTRARYFYTINKMGKARYYFLKSELNFKTILYYLTTFGGSGFVKKRFNVFG
jgi:glycosyltransferase involved in cell wall biosynthesis